MVVCLQIPGISLFSYSFTAGAEEVRLFLQERVSHHCVPERSHTWAYALFGLLFPCCISQPRPAGRNAKRVNRKNNVLEKVDGKTLHMSLSLSGLLLLRNPAVEHRT